MSVPPVMTQQRYQMDANAVGIASVMQSFRLNAMQFKTWLDTFTDQQLQDPPYGYTVDETYALRLFAQLANQYALIGGDGGTMTATEATQLKELAARNAGMNFVPAKMPPMGVA